MSEARARGRMTPAELLEQESRMMGTECELVDSWEVTANDVDLVTIVYRMASAGLNDQRRSRLVQLRLATWSSEKGAMSSLIASSWWEARDE